jgi:integrase
VPLPLAGRRLQPGRPALFALGYWAGCRVSEVSWLEMAHTHVGPQVGWLHVGQDGSKGRDIDLLNEAREPLYAYLQATGDTARTYVFPSQRSGRLTEEGIYYWFRALKAQGTRDQREVMADLSFNDLRHDFGQRAREAGGLRKKWHTILEMSPGKGCLLFKPQQAILRSAGSASKRSSKTSEGRDEEEGSGEGLPEE